ncbi:MAG: hypothetical protein HY438_00765 [DPANN group archaeon]|nr:hypothetical protein [DPANN group archaeon]
METNLKDVLAGLTNVSEKQIKVERDENLEHVVKELHKIFLAEHEDLGDMTYAKRGFREKCSLLAGLDITPKAVEEFCYELKIHEQQERFIYEAGLMIGLAVQASFNAGYNNFYLPVGHFENELQYLCNNSSGTKDRRLELTIEGNFNHGLKYIKFLKLLIKGNVLFVSDNAQSCEIELIGNLGDKHGIGSGMMHAKNSKIKISGNVIGKLFGSNADGCNFEITGRSVGSCGTGAKNSKFIFHQNPGESSAQFSGGCEYVILGWNNDWRIGAGSHNCVYKCKSEATIKELVEALPDKTLNRPRDNKIYKIHDDGSETLVAEI